MTWRAPAGYKMERPESRGTCPATWVNLMCLKISSKHPWFYVLLGPDPVKIPPSCWFLFAIISPGPPRRHSSSISLSSRKKMAFLWGPQSWEYRSELLSDSFLPLVMSADVLNRVPETLQLDVPTSLPAILSWSSFPAPPPSYWHLLPQVTEFT